MPNLIFDFTCGGNEIEIEPESGVSKPMINERIVDLPHPDGPTIDVIALSRNVISKLVTASALPPLVVAYSKLTRSNLIGMKIARNSENVPHIRPSSGSRGQQ